MINVRKMSEHEAYQYLDFVAFRLMGWEVVERAKHHPNSKAAKASLERFRQLIGAQHKMDDFLAATIAGQPVCALWLDDMQAHQTPNRARRGSRVQVHRKSAG